MPAFQPESAAPQPLDPIAQATLDRWDGYGYPKIFINYRNSRPDAAQNYSGDWWASLLLDDYLSGWFGASAIFRATRSVPRCPGFATLLRRAVAECTVFMPVIGAGWEESLASHPWVVEEWRIALAAGKVILPVIIKQELRPAPGERLSDKHDVLVPSPIPGLPFGSRTLAQDCYQIACEIVSHVPDIQLLDTRKGGSRLDVRPVFSSVGQ
jgi:hypothetical protein